MKKSDILRSFIKTKRVHAEMKKAGQVTWSILVNPQTLGQQSPSWELGPFSSQAATASSFVSAPTILPTYNIWNSQPSFIAIPEMVLSPIPNKFQFLVMDTMPSIAITSYSDPKKANSQGYNRTFLVQELCTHLHILYGFSLYFKVQRN